MIINIEGNYSTMSYVLTVSTLASATVTVVKNNKTYTQIADNTGMTLFQNLSQGIWAVTATSQDGYLTNTVSIDLQEDTSITIPLNSIPDFTYSISAANGGYAVYDDNGNDITSNPVTQGNWKIKFYKTGVLTINQLNGMTDGIDVFCVGGGGNGGSSSSASQGGGGGGGYTTTKLGVSVPTGKYDISIGGSGGTTYAFKGTSIEVSAKNGKNGTMYDGTVTGASGGDGGSGGGGIGCAGGSNGGDGGTVTTSVWGNGGKGQGNPPGTKEFHESTGTLYAGGGGGGAHAYTADYETGTNGGYNPGAGGAGGGGRGGGGFSAANAANGTANTGGGGGGQGTGWGLTYASGHGGSGIVIIRNKR